MYDASIQIYAYNRYYSSYYRKKSKRALAFL